ncbi:hypothetical protein HYX08_03945 [Candidatus Woesearchaeota archaeon]|nr:hypothetical protein [Candidatus Woesearchaeota archaeon]
MNKKAIGIGFIVLLVLGVLVLITGTNLIRRPTSEAARITASELYKAALARCGFDTQRAMERGLVLTQSNDRDGDGLKDDCDPCVCSDAGCKNNDVTHDGDGDDVPRSCDKNDNDKIARDCDNFVMTSDRRCVEGGAAPVAKV